MTLRRFTFCSSLHGLEIMNYLKNIAVGWMKREMDIFGA